MLAGPPVLVVTNMLIRSVGPVSEENMVSEKPKYLNCVALNIRPLFQYSRLMPVAGWKGFCVLQMFSMDCYFRQEWNDSRLAFNVTNNINVLRPSIKMLELIWKPDTYFLNGQDSYVHKITYVNKFLRIYNHGLIYYSQRYALQLNDSFSRYSFSHQNVCTENMRYCMLSGSVHLQTNVGRTSL